MDTVQCRPADEKRLKGGVDDWLLECVQISFLEMKIVHFLVRQGAGTGAYP